MTTEDAFTDRLSDYLDDEDLSPAERGSIAAHITGCAACRRRSRISAPFARAHRRSTDSGPAVDLWPALEDRLSAGRRVLPFAAGEPRRFSFTLPQLVAAGLALMVLSGGLVWMSRIDDERTNLPPVAAQSASGRGAAGTGGRAPADRELRGHALRRSHRGSRESARRQIAAGSIRRRSGSSRRIFWRLTWRLHNPGRRCAPIPRTCISTTTSPSTAIGSSRSSAGRARWPWPKGTLDTDDSETHVLDRARVDHRRWC